MVSEAVKQMYMNWKASMDGDDVVKQKMIALLDVQKRGFEATAQNQIITRGARAELLEHNRAVTTLKQSWELAHPSLDLFTRGMAGLGATAHAVLSVMNSINLLILGQAQKQQDLQTATDNVREAQLKYNEAVKAYGANSPQAVKAHEDLVKAQHELTTKINEGKTAWLQWATVGISGGILMVAQIRNVANSLALLGPSSPYILGALAVIALLAAAYATNFLGMKDKLQAWITDTTDRFNKWKTDNADILANWQTASGDQILKFVKTTAQGIADWALDTLIGVTDWAIDVLDAFTKLADKIVDAMQTGAWDKLFDDDTTNILMNKMGILADKIALAFIKGIEIIPRALLKMVGIEIPTEVQDAIQNVIRAHEAEIQSIRNKQGMQTLQTAGQLAMNPWSQTAGVIGQDIIANQTATMKQLSNDFVDYNTTVNDVSSKLKTALDNSTQTTTRNSDIIKLAKDATTQAKDQIKVLNDTISSPLIKGIDETTTSMDDLNKTVTTVGNTLTKLTDTITTQNAIQILPIVASKVAPSVDTSSIDKQIQDTGAKITQRENAIYRSHGVGSEYIYAQDPERAALVRQQTALQVRRDDLIKSAQEIFATQQGQAMMGLMNQISGGRFGGISPAVMGMITAPMQQQIFAAQGGAQTAGIEAFNRSLALPAHDVINKDFVTNLRMRGYEGAVTNVRDAYQGRGGSNYYINVEGSLIQEKDLYTKIDKSIAQNTSYLIR